ncbi:hypothetical protein ACHAXT_011215 [Thalassiosira profunda]
MKALSPSATAAVALLAGAAAGVASADVFPYAKPGFRFSPFEQLSTTSQMIAEEELGYNAITWNNHALAPIEQTRFAGLTSNERDAAIQLGFTEGTWDCFINHYENFGWDELADKGVQEHFRELGWSQAHWDGTADDVPYTEARWWGMLTDNEKRAANAICYFEDNWNGYDMNPNKSFFPHQVPEFRFKPWSELDGVTQNVAKGMLNYTQELWDNLGSHTPERNTFLNLDADEREGAMELGFYTHSWDCFMNHYLSYYWSSFHDDLKVAIETLGWTEEMWSDNDTYGVPETENKIWIDLTPEEKAAATRMCYFKETWDEESIPDFFDYDRGVNTAVATDGPVPEDIKLEIFDKTGYAGKSTDEIGGLVVRADPSSSYRAVVSSAALGLAVSVGALLFA